MIDDLIEAHVLARLQEAYPDLDTDQVVVQIHQVDFDHSTAYRANTDRTKHAIGQEMAMVEALVENDTKLDRTAFIKLMPCKPINLGGTLALQQYLGTRQIDRLEVIGTKGTVFRLRYTYDLFPD